MYYCDGCKQFSRPGEPLNLVVAEKRDMEYTNDHKKTRGWEIVREERLCPRCSEARSALRDTPGQEIHEVLLADAPLSQKSDELPGRLPGT